LNPASLIILSTVAFPNPTFAFSAISRNARKGLLSTMPSIIVFLVVEIFVGLLGRDALWVLPLRMSLRSTMSRTVDFAAPVDFVVPVCMLVEGVNFNVFLLQLSSMWWLKAFLIFLIVDLKFKALVFLFSMEFSSFIYRYKFILALTKLGNPPQLPKFGNIHFCPKAEGALFPLVAKL
jgi:hypothetical protein